VVTIYSAQTQISPAVANRCPNTGVGPDYNISARVAGTSNGTDDAYRSVDLGWAYSQPPISSPASPFA